ncbi:hypothetical protein ACIRYZ_41340 [Kitasatospora sp. NPDC101155]|uniref:hypothetical protein n=1 Tax=Kitasatospora sp. NPDC101155 TaxID=3364097 RepID=UPI00380AE79D
MVVVGEPAAALRHGEARAGAEDNPAVGQGHPAVRAVDVALRPAAGEAGAVVQGADAVMHLPGRHSDVPVAPDTVIPGYHSGLDTPV